MPYILGSSSAQNATDTGVLATLTFKVKEGAAAGDYTVGVTCIESSDENELDVATKTENGTITVIDFLYCDCDGDGKINGKDATRLLQYLANYDPTTGESTVEANPGADCNGDGKVNGKDATRLLQYLANYDPTTGESTTTLGPKN